MRNQESSQLLFREEQRFRQKWLWAILWLDLLVVFLVVGAVLIKQGLDKAPDLWLLGLVLLLSVGLLYLFYSMKLITEVRADALYLRFFPLARWKKIEFQEIESCEAKIYNPILEYGGWGIRFGRKKKAYNISGNEGVQLELAHDKPFLIGSQRAEELAQAIRSRL